MFDENSRKPAISKNLSLLQVLTAAVLFGISTPVSKYLLGEIAPISLSALLYLGSGIGLLLWHSLENSEGQDKKEAKLNKRDLPWLIGAIIAGGIAAPIILMFSLKAAPAATASLLLNFEGVATTVIAAIIFKEHVSRRVWGAVTLITVASILLSWNPSGQWGFSVSALGVLAACGLWGVDNNFTRNISAKNPLTIVMFKGLSAGIFSLVLARSVGQLLPPLLPAICAMLLGCASYGLSILLFIHAMRELGSARTSALFGIAPFLGAIISVFAFQETLGFQFIISLPIMLLGAGLLLKEDHVHWHRHEPLVHEHRHGHADQHHSHSHPDVNIKANEYHSHVHRHEPMEHSHGHTPNIHHRHCH
ncbi:MAG: EamA family transporter [Syntrophomonadaceae bacterium]|nr:EamA family transporter [Syntrophomonadaceae bacterium]